MNVIYIHTHDTGRLIQPYGCGVATPNLLRLAQVGTIFRQAYCAAPTCSPSRAAMLTGINAHSCGVTGLVHRGFALNDSHKHLASFLNSYGYVTALCGVQHETGNDPSLLGYRHVFTAHPYAATDFESIDRNSTADAIAYLETPKTQPFFLSLGFVNTHRDFPQVTEPTSPNYVSVPATMPDRKDIRKDFAAFIDSAKIVDSCCGQLFDTLDKLQLWDDTLVFLEAALASAGPHQ